MLKLVSLGLSFVLLMGVLFLWFRMKKMQQTIDIIQKESKVHLVDDDVKDIVSEAVSKSMPKVDMSDSIKEVNDLKQQVNTYMGTVHKRIEHELFKMHNISSQANSVNNSVPENAPKSREEPPKQERLETIQEIPPHDESPEKVADEDEKQPHTETISIQISDESILQVSEESSKKKKTKGRKQPTRRSTRRKKKSEDNE